MEPINRPVNRGSYQIGSRPSFARPQPQVVAPQPVAVQQPGQSAGDILSQPTALEASFAPPVAKPKKRRMSKRTVLMAATIVFSLAIGAVGSYFLRNMTANKQYKQDVADMKFLEQSNADLQKQVNDAKAAATSVPAATTANTSVAQNVQAAITAGNTAALTGYMAPKVYVVIAASEGLGLKAPADATTAVTNFIKSAKAPWNFNQPAATLGQWGSGDYAQYFPANALVGKAASNQVISVTFNANGKVNMIFMSADSKLL